MLIFFVFQFHTCLCSSLCQTMKIRCFQCSGHGKIYISFPFSYILWSLSLSLIVLSILSLFRFHSFLLSRVILRVEFCIFFPFLRLIPFPCRFQIVSPCITIRSVKVFPPFPLFWHLHWAISYFILPLSESLCYLYRCFVLLSFGESLSTATGRLLHLSFLTLAVPWRPNDMSQSLTGN